MFVEVSPAPNSDVLAAARDRVQLAPMPDWVQPCSYSAEFKSKSAGSVTDLLLERQLNAELRQTFLHRVMRLETMQAVQHSSQWRVEFSPQTQAIQLHSIKVRRGGNEREHARRERLQFLQREAGLEGLVIDGWVTVLLLLEDVRPGDILEWSYTLRHQPPLLPECCAGLFTLPEQGQLGKHYLLVRFNERRPCKWKSSDPNWKPTEQRENDQVRWIWEQENVTSPEPEPGMPSWHLDRPWIQISDCEGWRPIATAFCNAWKENDESPALTAAANAIALAETEPVRRVERALRLVQDEFRYLSVNLELGGQVPADSETVLRRRYGDCKDLAFLLVQLLRLLDVPARPLLVNTFLRRSIRQMLPAPGLFNHAIVEYQIGNATRWVDATLKGQGGGALDRVIPDYGPGLPVDATATELISPPAAKPDSGGYEIKESFLMDTRGAPSYLGVTVIAKGFHAENLRLQFENEGLEAIAKKRLQACADRFSKARRVGSLQYRDERDANQFILAEVFEIEGFLIVDTPHEWCWFELQNVALAGILPFYERHQPARRTPLALPYPCKVTHTIDIESLGLEVSALPGMKSKNEFFEFSCTGRGVRKFATATFTLTTLADSIAPDRLRAYQDHVEQVRPLALLRVRLPVGYARVRKRSDFGALPPISKAARGQKTATRRLTPSPNIAVINEPPQEQTDKARADMEHTVLLDSPPDGPGQRRGQRHRSFRRFANPQWRSELIWIVAFIGGVLVIFGLLFLMHLASIAAR